ncbi:MAG: RHS repeat-associated core domain-containing protein, partial [Candidatus Polarisedimenticolia bacterium]
RLPGKLRQTVGASWDALGRMTTFVEGDPKTELGAPAETYRYAADGFRWLRAGADGKATLTLRDAQGRPLAEYVVARGGAGPTLSREYVHALGQVVAERTWTTSMGTLPKVTFHHRDHLGSLRVATDAAGALADAHDYYPFGGEMGPVASSSRKKFTGHERDEETGLDYMLARYYPGSMGRFLSVDPGFDVQPESPQSWNLYGYVGNNPVNAIDSDGRTEKSALQLIRDNAGAITLAAAVATYVTNVPVKAEEIARIVYEENRNDFNIVRGNDSNVLNRISQGLGVGGPEVKNAVGEELMRKGLSNADRSFGICEMKISTAAKALGMDPAKLADFQKIQILNLLNDNTTAVLLAGLHLAHLRAANPNVPIEGLLTLYNSGKWTGKVSEVAARSGPKLPEIRKALGE